MPQSYSPLEWKKNFLKLPVEIEVALSKIPVGEKCIVGCAKLVTNEELKAGNYRHLYVETVSDIPENFETLIPSQNIGPVSYRNVMLIERIDKSRGKHSKVIYGRAPTRWRGGFHGTSYRRDVWHKIFLQPAMSRIAFKRLDQDVHQKGIMVRFQVEEIIDRTQSDYLVTLLRCVNLLQENVGKIGLFPLSATEEEFIRNASEDIGWQVVPDLKRAEVWGGITRKLSKRSPELGRKVQERFDFIKSLKPRRVMHGTRGFVGYFAVEFTDSLTVFEHLEMDHAMYVIRNDVQKFSHLTRTELTAHLHSGVEKIIHSKNWKTRLGEIVKKARGEAAPGELI